MAGELAEFPQWNALDPGPEGERGFLLPIMRQGNKLSPAVPGILHEPYQSLARLLQSYQPGTGDEQPVRDAANVAGAVMMPSLGLNAMGMMPKNALGIFGGRLAKTADHNALAKAEQMAASGSPREAIWNETGWFQGVDGKWRFEINDRGAAVPTMGGTGPASTMLPHPQFSAAYPQMDKLHTVIDTTDSTLGGSFGRHPVYGDTIVIGASNMTAARKLGLHERQHATQKEEGFQRGANPQSFKSDPDTIRKIITGQLDDMLPEKSIFADYLATAAQLEVPGFKGTTLGELKQHILAQQLLGRLPADMSGIAKRLSDTIAHNRYRRTAGEVEARNVERRSMMSDEQRRAKPPWQTQDIPDPEQILRPLP